jgi:hypothetical protein
MREAAQNVVLNFVIRDVDDDDIIDDHNTWQ